MTKLSKLHLVGLPQHSLSMHLNDVFYSPLCLTKEKVLAYDAKNKSNSKNQGNNVISLSLSEISFDTKVKLNIFMSLIYLNIVLIDNLLFILKLKFLINLIN